VVAGFLAFLLLVVDLLDAWACTFFRQLLREEPVFSVWQYALVPGLGLVAGTGAGAEEGAVVVGSSVWAKDGAARAMAATALRPAIKRRMKILPGRFSEGTVRPRIVGKKIMVFWPFMSNS
jgi:hypothetical protein